MWDAVPPRSYWRRATMPASWAAILNDLRNYVRRTLKFSWATSSRVFRNEPEP
jgi:hypothetical protein